MTSRIFLKETANYGAKNETYERIVVKEGVAICTESYGEETADVCSGSSTDAMYPLDEVREIRKV